MNIRDVYEWHQEMAQEFRGDDESLERSLHEDMARALRPHLPPLPCYYCRGVGYVSVQEDDCCDVMICDCRGSDVTV